MFKKINEMFRKKIDKPLLITLVICYLIILVRIILFKANIKTSIYTGPEDLLYENIWVRYKVQFNGFTLSDISIWEDFFLNVTIFLPLPIFLKLLFTSYNFWIN